MLSTHLEGQVIARLVKAEGRVHFKRLGMSTFSEQGRPGAPIKNGDEIKVGEKSFAAVIYLDDRSILKVRENTKFSFMDTRNSRTVDLAHGTLLNDIKKEGRNKIRSLIRLIPIEFSLILVAGPTEGKLSRLASSRLVLATI